MVILEKDKKLKINERKSNFKFLKDIQSKLQRKEVDNGQNDKL